MLVQYFYESSINLPMQEKGEVRKLVLQSCKKRLLKREIQGNVVAEKNFPYIYKNFPIGRNYTKSKEWGKKKFGRKQKIYVP